MDEDIAGHPRSVPFRYFLERHRLSRRNPPAIVNGITEDMLSALPCASNARREIGDWVGASIAGYKKPRCIEFVRSIPRNVSGKILTVELTSRPTLGEQRAWA